MAADLNTTPCFYTHLPPVPVVLAGGDSVRMGVPKALLRLGGGTFLSCILDLLASLDLPDPLLVLGRHAPLVQGNLRGGKLKVLVNEHPEQGQLSSLQLAVRNLGPCSGCLAWPVDQPAVQSHVIRSLLRLFRESGALIVMPVCGGKRGHPAIFSSRLFGEILALPAESGAKVLVASHAKDIVCYETDDRATVEDIDTPEDYARLIGSAGTA